MELDMTHKNIIRAMNIIHEKDGKAFINTRANLIVIIDKFGNEKAFDDIKEFVNYVAVYIA
jgi:uncharacterized protein YrzB (UPF0473 family)